MSKSVLQYPNVRRDESVVDSYHGKLIADPYRWLEALSSDEVKTFAEEQNAITDEYLKKDDNARNIIKDKLTELCTFPEVECPFRRGDNYFYFNDGILYMLRSLDEEGISGIPILDPSSDPNLCRSPNANLSSSLFEKTGENFGNRLCSISNNGEYLAYGVSEGGSVWSTIHFKNVRTGEHYKEKLENVQDTYLSWTRDSKGIFYGRYPDNNSYENQAIYYHVLGTDQSQDRLVVDAPTSPKWELKSKVSDCGTFLIVYVLQDCGGHTMVYLGRINGLLISATSTNLKEANRGKNPNLIQLVGEFDADYDYITNSDSAFYFLTNKDAPNSMVIRIDVDFGAARVTHAVVVKPHPRNVLEWVVCANQYVNSEADSSFLKYLISCYMQDVKSILQVRCLRDGSFLKALPIPVGTITGHCGRREDSQCFFKFTSFLNPGTIYQVDLDKFEEGRETGCVCRCSKWLRNDIDFQIFKASLLEVDDPILYKIKQVFYRSKDETDVSLFLVYKKSLIKNGENPCILYGYGGFGSNLKPNFDPVHLAFVKLFSGIFAVANVRGGGEYGKSWYENGILLKKQNSFDDFQAAAEYLIRKKYTCPRKIAIHGNSNGGLLVGVCINQRPDLFGAAVAGYGVMDMLRFQHFTTGPCWTSDYGSVNNRTDFENLFAFSPLHNVRVPKDSAVQYPAVLLITSDHDERVLPLHSYKLIAELQHKIGACPKQKNPLVIRTETNSGHGEGMSFESYISAATDILTFIMFALGLQLS